MQDKRLVVYTALFGDYDELPDPLVVDAKCDFICFTDQKSLTSSVWKVVYIDINDKCPIMMNRHYKLFPNKYLKMYNYSVYIDSNIVIKQDITDMVLDLLSDVSLVVPKHFLRDCIFDEAKECIALNRVGIWGALAQMRHYRSCGMPSHFGLTENGILLRKHSDENLILLMELWWKELTIYTKRDQLSLCFILWKCKYKFRFAPFSVRYNNSFFSLIGHKKEASFLQKLMFKIRVTLLRAALKFVKV